MIDLLLNLLGPVPNILRWWGGRVVERRCLAGERSLSCDRPAADVTTYSLWVNRPVQVSQL